MCLLKVIQEYLSWIRIRIFKTGSTDAPDPDKTGLDPQHVFKPLDPPRIIIPPHQTHLSTPDIFVFCKEPINFLSLSLIIGGTCVYLEPQTISSYILDRYLKARKIEF